MSAEAVGWVFRESPYDGVMFALHLAVADTVNDTYGNELWASAPTLASKARISERSARSGLAKMVSDGLLIVVAERPGTVRRYRFAMPADPCTACTPAPAAPLHATARTPATRSKTPATRRATPAPAAPNPNNPKIPSGTQASREAAFEQWWSRYPRKVAKGAARAAFGKALKKVPLEVLVAGADAYANDPARKPDYTKHPATWLNSECWEDQPDQERRRSKGTAAALRLVERHNGPKELNA